MTPAEPRIVITQNPQFTHCYLWKLVLGKRTVAQGRRTGKLEATADAKFALYQWRLKRKAQTKTERLPVAALQRAACRAVVESEG